MPKHRVSTDNGDILFYGHFTGRPSHISWTKVGFNGSPQQHAELTGHLNRHSSQWLLEDRRSHTEGLVMYDLPPYFRVETVPDDESETDAAVHTVNPAILEPTFPAPNAKDPYTDEIDFNYVYKGERFRSVQTIGKNVFVRYGTFAMDGLAISEDYGWLTFEEKGDTGTAEAKRKAYDPERSGAKPYINVHYDDQPEGHYFAGVCADRRKGIEYVPQGAGWPNEGLALPIGTVIYGLPEVAKRKNQRLAESRKIRERAEAEAKLADAERRVRTAEEELARAKRRLAGLG